MYPFLKSVEERANEFCAQRGISLKAQRRRLFVNLMEEVSELLRSSNKYEKIDALADICIFILGAYSFNPTKAKYLGLNTLQDRWYITSLMWRIYDGVNNPEIAEDVSIVVHWCVLEMERLGFDPIVVFDETFKEINSREGVYDEFLGKIKKDRNSTHQTPYKADYSLAKVGKEVRW